MKTSYRVWRISLIILSTNFCACQEENAQPVTISDDSVPAVYAGSTPGHKNGPLLEAQFQYPTLIAIGPDKSLYVVDGGSAVGQQALLTPGTRIRKINPAGIVSTFFDITKSNSGIQSINGLAVNKAGDVYISEGDQIKMIRPDGRSVGLIAGTGSHEIMKDGPAIEATFYQPSALAFDKNDCLYIMDTKNNAVRFYSNGKVSTIAGGDRTFNPEYPGTAPLDGTGTNAQFDNPQFLTLGPDGLIYVSGGYFPGIRKVTQAGVVTTLVRGSNEYESEALHTFRGITFSPAGNLFVNLNYGRPVRNTFSFAVSMVSLQDLKFTELASNSYEINDQYPYADADGFPSFREEGLNFPTGMLVLNNTLYICNSNSHKILKIDLE